MIFKPTNRDGYGSQQLERVRRTCLYMATKLGDLLDEIVGSADWFRTFLFTSRIFHQAWSRMQERWIWTWGWRWPF